MGGRGTPRRRRWLRSPPAAPTPEEAALAALGQARAAEHTLVTLDRGREIGEAQVGMLRAKIQEQFSGLDVEVVVGGQPYYPYLIALE